MNILKNFKITSPYTSFGECVKDLIYMAFATFIIAFGVYFFMEPSRAAVSSVSALAVILANVLPASVSQLALIMNVVLLIVGFALFGSEFGFKTIYTSLILPVFLAIFEHVHPDNVSLTNDALLDVIVYILLASFGCAMLFNDNASSGGLDIVAKVLNKYFKIELGSALAVAGILIACSTIFVYDTKSVILSLFGTFINGVMLDYFIFGQNIKKRVCIISEKEELIREFIINELHSGATLYKAVGAYNMKERPEIVCILTKQEYQKLMSFMEVTDPKAFVTVYTVSEIRYMPKILGTPREIDLNKERIKDGKIA